MADESARGQGGVTIERSVVMLAPAGRRRAATLPVRTWNEGERFVRAVKRLGLFWGAALVAAIIPPHWPWFSLCVLIGPIAAYLRWNEAGTLQACAIECPNCGAAVAFEEQAERWPAAARCTECRDVFSIEPAADAAKPN